MGIRLAKKKAACDGCGECCSNFLPLTRNEITELKAYVKEHGIKQTGSGMECPFLDKAKPWKKCAVYEARPLICRDYQCNKSVEKANLALLWERRLPTDMRATFFK